jgi:hypothetical protein
LTAAILLLAGLGIYYLQTRKTPADVAKRVTVLFQDEASTPDEFIPEEMQEFIPPEGENLAEQKKITESGHADVYFAAKAIDGRDTTYWEGNGFPSSITIDLEGRYSISKLALRLPPLRVWSARTQTLQIEVSTDNESFETIFEGQAVEFDPMTGNGAILSFDSVDCQYVRIIFTANTGAGGGQLSEILIFE